MTCADIVRNQHLDGLADQLFPRVAEQSLALGVDQANHALGVYNHQTVRRQFQDAAKELLRLAQPLFSTPALRDVAEADDGSHQLAAFPDWRGTILNRQPLAVLTPQKLAVNAARFAVRISGKHRALLERVLAAIGTVVMEEPVGLLINHLHHGKAQ